MILQGLGFEVLAQVVESICPTHVMQLTTLNPNNNLPSDIWWLPEGLSTQQNPLVYQLPSVGALQQNMGVDLSGILAGFILGICSELQPAYLHLYLQLMPKAGNPLSEQIDAYQDSSTDQDSLV